MKLVVQIPCHNEAATLPAVLADIPGQIPGVSAIKVLVIDDGSSDETAAVAKAAGVEYTIEKVTDINEIMKFGVMMTPGLAVDGQVKTVGKIPTVSEIQGMLK